MTSKVSDLNSLFSSIYEGAFFVQRQTEMIPRLVMNASARTMSPRIFPKVTQTTAGTVAEGSAPTVGTYAKTAAGTSTPVIYHHQFKLTDEMIMTDPDDARRMAVTEIGAALSAKIDSDGVGLFSGYTQVKGTGGSALTLGNVAAAMSVLQTQMAPMPIRAMIHPYQWHDLLTQMTSVNVNPVTAPLSDVANEALRTYFASRYIGVEWYLAPAIGTTGTAGTAFGAMFSPEAQVYDERTPMQMEIERDSSTRSYLVNGIIRAGQARRRPEFGVALRSRASEPS